MCGSRIYDISCKECGLVNDEFRFVSSIMRRDKDKEIIVPLFRHHLEPDIEFSHIFPKKAKNKELRRALYRQRKKWNKGYIDYYQSVYLTVEKICSYLQLPQSIKYDTLHLIKKMMAIDIKYFSIKSKKEEYRTLACIKIACELHEFFLSERELISVSSEQPNEKVNLLTNSIKKGINREYMNIKNNLKITSEFPKKPKMISYICNKIGLPQTKETELYIFYEIIRKYLNRIYKLKGYLVSLVYFLYKDEFDIKLSDLEDKFEVNRATIYSRKTELEGMFNYIKGRGKK